MSPAGAVAEAWPRTVASDSPYASRPDVCTDACGGELVTCRNGCGIGVQYHPDHWHGQRHVIGQYWHAGGRSLCQLAPGEMPHCAGPVPRCPDCGATDGYGSHNTMYGIQTGCGACGYSHYFSIGD